MIFNRSPASDLGLRFSQILVAQESGAFKIDCIK